LKGHSFSGFSPDREEARHWSRKFAYDHLLVLALDISQNSFDLRQEIQKQANCSNSRTSSNQQLLMRVRLVVRFRTT
ncbi:MAG: hypothetical protein K8F91_18635, partial [Candidatus Obscuribacterales bacterium]|nr:hypothetical protein [Candidatus Obscuribacterales bacterium]